LFLKDYSESEQGVNRNIDDNIFIYNQSQNPSSGNRGIACIALGVICNSEFKPTNDTVKLFETVFATKTFHNMVSSKIISDDGNLECFMLFIIGNVFCNCRGTPTNIFRI
jgi:hypothetical protein